MKLIFSIFTSFLFLNFYGQRNYTWLKINKHRVGILAPELREASGLVWSDGNLYTINDGGNTSEIFEIDKKSGEILNIIKTDLKNIDWEAITSDDEHFYIGDFGNNLGNRKELQIFKVNKTDAQNVDTIRFYYPEQEDFSPRPHQHNFDAESMIYKRGNLHLFTKEWRTYQATHYKINTNVLENPQAAEKLETYYLGYLATDASYYRGRLYIIGYTRKMEVYMTVFQEDEDGIFFTNPAKKYYLGSTSNLGQIEGIAVNEDGVYILGEEFRYKIFNAPASFYFIPKEKLE